MRDSPLLHLVLVLVPLSLVSLGGGASILAPLHHQTIDVYRWLNQREFVDMFAISRAAPGPGALLVTLIGWKVASWPGALVATIAMFLPSSLLCYAAARIWNRARGGRIHSALETGLAPVGTGLIIAGAIAVLRASETGVLGWLIASAATLLLMWRSLHPLVVLASAGALFAIASRLAA